MGDYCKETDSDCREATWPKGLYRRGDSFRFRRMAGRCRVIEVWGLMPEADAVRKATRYNLDLDEGRLPAKERAQREMTVEGFAREVWLNKKATEVGASSVARYRAVVDHFIDYLERVRGLSDCGDVSSQFTFFRRYVPDASCHTSRDFTSDRRGAFSIVVVPNPLANDAAKYAF